MLTPGIVKNKKKDQEQDIFNMPVVECSHGYNLI